MRIYCVTHREDVIDPPQVLKPSNVSNSFFLRCVTQLEILKTISNLKANTSSGWDDISYKFVRGCCTELIKPLQYLINSSFSQWSFPDLLKVTEIRPGHKKRITTDVQNYRSISLTSRLLLDQLESFFCKYNVLKSSQHGFRKDRPIITAVATFFQAVLDKLDDGNKVIATF
ncbi:uncharacterized protein LOC126483041 [Schistocerca serialis cubense]|uniref:uncharacterized protein LOC126483041 n=1 Tax=Schistocerca serialis cubense TaxID=2023355 RepID=UPI00214F3F69|nr:uncharacterized protein LOC126483041 [Schistocerca serialis cubense]